jgi:hypothetical protein
MGYPEKTDNPECGLLKHPDLLLAIASGFYKGYHKKRRPKRNFWPANDGLRIRGRLEDSIASEKAGLQGGTRLV